MTDEFFVKLESQKMFFKILLQGGIPSLDLGFKNLLKSDKNEDFKLGAIFTTRGQQTLNFSGKIDFDSLRKNREEDKKVIPDLEFYSNFVYNTHSQEFAQNSTFTFPLLQKVLSKTSFNVSEGEFELGTAVEYTHNDKLVLEGYIGLLNSNEFSFMAKYLPQEYLQFECEYSNDLDIDDNTKPIPLGYITSKVLYKSTEFTSFFGEHTVDISEKTTELELGLETSPKDSNSTIKATVNPEKELTASIKYDWSEYLKLFASSKMNLEDFDQAQEVELGIGLEYAF